MQSDIVLDTSGAGSGVRHHFGFDGREGICEVPAVMSNPFSGWHVNAGVSSGQQHISRLYPAVHPYKF